MPDLCPKGADLGVKSSAASCSLTLPLYPGLPTEQVESQGTLPGRVASVMVEINNTSCGQDYIDDSEKVHKSHYGTNSLLYDLTWRNVMHVLGQMLTPDSRA